VCFPLELQAQWAVIWCLRRSVSPDFGTHNPWNEGLNGRLGQPDPPIWGPLPSRLRGSRGAASGACATLLAVRVVIADDHRLVLDGIKRALESDGGFEIVGETQSGTQVLPLVGKTNPDLVLLDVRMPHMDGLACLDQLRTRHPGVKVVMLSASSNPELVEAALRRGASAYVIKTVNPDDLPATLRQALEGNVHTAVGGEETERASAKALGLTERELTILGALARGLSNDEIAKEFWVAPQTVKFHLTNIYRKLGVKNRTEATRIAYQHGLVESPIYADE
jgi:DNA-binding NarL/FixJ family response regulator